MTFTRPNSGKQVTHPQHRSRRERALARLLAAERRWDAKLERYVNEPERVAEEVANLAKKGVTAS